MEEAQMDEDVEASPLSESMQRKLDKLSGKMNEAPKNFTIFRKPHNISQSKKNLFKPSVISIGPFHHGKEHLRALEEQKWQFLRDFLSRGDHISLDLCISEMKLLELRTRRCYSETFDYLKSNAFVEMMLLDGCFVLEFFFKMSREEGLDLGRNEFGWYYIFVRRDLLLLENQIPFFVVEKLFEIINLNKEVHKMLFVKKLARIFFSLGQIMDYIDPIFPYSTYSTYSIDIDSEIPDPPAEIHHLVHLCYHYLVLNPNKPIDLTRTFNSEKPFVLSLKSLTTAKVIPFATELKHKGLKFKPNRYPRHMLDISFEYGILKIPKLVINHDNKHNFANLVAFEYSKYDKEHSPFTRFVEFWDNLVNTENDVKILQECGIIENGLGSEEDVTHFFKQFIEVDIFERDHYLAELYTEVDKYIEINWNQSSWNKERAKLIRYKEISLTAFVDISLTFVQSFFTVYTYYVPRKS